VNFGRGSHVGAAEHADEQRGVRLLRSPRREQRGLVGAEVAQQQAERAAHRLHRVAL